MIKVVALDLDGTIVNEELKISEKTVALLQHLIHNTDVKIVVATGRMFLSALPFARQLQVKEPVVAYQGAMIRMINEPHDVCFHNPIPMDIATDLLSFLVKDDYQINLYLDDDLWTTHTNNHATYYARTAGVTPLFTADLLGQMTLPPTKIMVIDDHRIDELLIQLESKYMGRLNYCRSRSNFCEIIDVGASKWKALETLINQWGIDPSEVMAIGDQGNDLSMIRGAGVGVAMGNAPDEIKREANYVTDTVDEDGAAKAIEKFVLGNMPLAEVS